MEEQHKEERKKIVSEALKIFEKNNIKARTIFEEGHPSEVITRVASEGGFDMIVIGSRGQGGLKKLFLGSVSSAVVNEADTNVLTVK
ncbi:MAG: universal stress protein [Bacillota bacterium]|nr:universal stress protein [Bacillota bacterium]